MYNNNLSFTPLISANPPPEIPTIQGFTPNVEKIVFGNNTNTPLQFVNVPSTFRPPSSNRNLPPIVSPQPPIINYNNYIDADTDTDDNTDTDTDNDYDDDDDDLSYFSSPSSFPFTPLSTTNPPSRLPSLAIQTQQRIPPTPSYINQSIVPPTPSYINRRVLPTTPSSTNISVPSPYIPKPPTTPVLPGINPPIDLKISNPIRTPTIPVVRPKLIQHNPPTIIGPVVPINIPQLNSKQQSKIDIPHLDIPQSGPPQLLQSNIPNPPQISQIPQSNIPKPALPQLLQSNIPKPGLPQMPQSNIPKPGLPQMPQSNISQMPQSNISQMPQSNIPKPSIPQMPQSNIPKPGLPQIQQSNIPKPFIPQMPQSNISQMPQSNIPKPGLPQIPQSNIPKPSIPQMPQSNVPQMPQSNIPKPGLPQMPQSNIPKTFVPQTPQSNIPKPGLPQTPQSNIPNPGLPQMPQFNIPKPSIPQMPQSNISQMPQSNISQMPQSNISQMPQSNIPKPGLPQMPQFNIPKPSIPQMPQSNIPKPSISQMPQSNIPKPFVPQMQQNNIPKVKSPEVIKSPIRINTITNQQEQMQIKPKILAYSPQRAPIGGTTTGIPNIPIAAPELIPLPVLVPVSDQANVSPIEAVKDQGNVIPVIMSPKTEYKNIIVPKITSPIRDQSIPILNNNTIYVDGHVASKHEDCCICMEEEIVPLEKVTQCKHAICSDCTKQLRKAECPICRAGLAGGYLTQDITQAIESRKQEDVRVQELVDYVYASYINSNPEREGQNFLNEARSLSEAFGTFISANPNISRNNATRIFRAFVNFNNNERNLIPNYLPSTAINDFSIIGLQMLEHPEQNFNDIYHNFYRQSH